jgi:hypothetical protein
MVIGIRKGGIGHEQCHQGGNEEHNATGGLPAKEVGKRVSKPNVDRGLLHTLKLP